MGPPVNVPAFTTLVAQAHELIKSNTRDQNAAMICAIHDAEAAINRKLEKIMRTLDDLLAAVAAQRTQIDSLVALTRGLHGQVLDAMGGTLTPSQQMRIDQVFEAIQNNADAVAAAVKENTVEATAGAVTGGPGLTDLRGANSTGQAPAVDPAPAADLPATDPATVTDPVQSGT
jgi:hypothetical protein